jgi:DNA polymerase/3'-5' exonuclease PolX
MTVPGIGPKTADRLVGECKVRGLRSLARAARQGRLQRLRGIGPNRERAWGEAAELLLMPALAGERQHDERVLAAPAAVEPGPAQLSLFEAAPAQPAAAAGPERAA